jgi:hypothetical protein
MQAISEALRLRVEEKEAGAVMAEGAIDAWSEPKCKCDGRGGDITANP